MIFTTRWHLYIKYKNGLYINSNVSYIQERQGGIYTLTILNGISTMVLLFSGCIIIVDYCMCYIIFSLLLKYTK